MDINRTISATEARQKFAEILHDVEKLGVHYTFTVNGKPKVAMVSAEELESLEETIAILSDPALMRRLRRSEQESAAGDVISLEELLSDSV